MGRRQLWSAIPDHLEDGRLRLGIRLGRRRRRIGPGDRETSDASVVREHVHHTPLGEIAGRERRNLSHRRADVERRGQHRRGLGDELDLPLAIPCFLGGHGLGGSKLLRLGLSRFPLTDVLEVPLDAERPARLVQHGDRLLPHPDDAPVARDHAVAQADGLRCIHRVPTGDDLVSVVLVDELDGKVWIREPFVGGVADEPVDLRTDERRLPVALERANVGDDRQVLPERSVRRLGVAKRAGEPACLVDVPRDDDRFGRLPARNRRDRCGKDVAVLRPLLDDLVQPLALARGVDDPARLGLAEQVGERTAHDLVGLVPIERFRAGAPRGDDAVAVDAQDGVGRGVPDPSEPALGESLVSRPLPPLDRQPSDRRAGDEEHGKREQPGTGLVRDEQVIQQPAENGCGERNGEEENPRPSQVRGTLSGLEFAAHESEARRVGCFLGHTANPSLFCPSQWRAANPSLEPGPLGPPAQLFRVSRNSRGEKMGARSRKASRWPSPETSGTFSRAASASR